MGDITAMLRQWSDGDENALQLLLPAVYQELHQIASAYLRREHPGHLLQPTALINEAYLRLVERRQPCWDCRSHFFGVASRLMRQILVDHFRSESAEKRGGQAQRITLREAETIAGSPDLDMLRVADALVTLEALDERKHRIVELYFFGGLTIAEAAAFLHCSESTVERELRVAKAWLAAELSP